MKIKACIFDFDGVLMDTEKYHYEAWNAVASIVGTEISWEEYSSLKSRGREYAIAFLTNKAGVTLTDELFMRLSAVKSEYFFLYTQKLSERDKLPGIEDFLRYLAEQHIPAALASSGSDTADVAEKFGFTKYFSVILDGKSGLKKKPDPALFTEAAKRLGVVPSKTAVFEDSPAGLAAAKAGGFFSVCVAENLPADARIKDFTDVQNLKVILGL